MQINKGRGGWLVAVEVMEAEVTERWGGGGGGAAAP